MQEHHFKSMTNEKTGSLKCPMPECGEQWVTMVGTERRGATIEVKFRCVKGHGFLLEFIQSSLGVSFELFPWE